MKLLIGPAAEGEQYFPRDYLTQKFWRILSQSANISIAAPRRVGKSSFMLNLVKEEKEGYKCIYLITESVNNANEFFKKIYKELLSQLETGARFKQFIGDVFKRLDIRKISLTQIEFGKSDINYFDEILFLCKEVKEFPYKVILLIDEFSQTIENIITDVSKEAARNFLHQCRELRQNPDVKSKIHFVYTGSIGLENLVISIEEPRSITDLGNLDIPPLSEKEANELITAILDNENYIFTTEDRLYLLKRLKWLLPFFIHVLMGEIENFCIEKGVNNITPEVIDEAFKNALRHRTYFEHWLSRLRIVFKGPAFSCSKEILNIAAKKDGIDYYELQDTMTKYNIEDTALIINTLIHDGYLVKDDAIRKYRFNSPLLEQWWLLNVAI